MDIDWDCLKEELAAAASAKPAWPEMRFAGRGIVICAGGPRLFTCAWVTIGILRRHLGCELPIEVWHIGPQEMGPPMRGLIEELGVETVDALEVAKRQDVERLGGWELKPYAVLHSRFAEVLLLDADNIPIRDPGFLFDAPEYRETGALFWPEIVRIAADNSIWALCGIGYRDMPSFESGQLLLDKARCWRPLCLTHWMNQHSDAFYALLHGDKDTFLVAWLMLGFDFTLIRHAPKRTQYGVAQRGPDGSLLFQHRNMAKWILDGDNPRISGFRLDVECRALLADLTAAWDGRVFVPPPRSRQAQASEAMLVGIGAFILIRVSSDERRIHLLPDHRIQPGIATERYWYVTDGENGLELRIEGRGVPVCHLLRYDDGVWRGRLLQSPGMPVELVPATPIASVENQAGGDLAPLVERVLCMGASLSWDLETERDVTGALRILALLDPGVTAQLSRERESWPLGSSRARVIGCVLDGIARSVGNPAPIGQGNGWLAPDRNWQSGYETP